MNIKIGKIYKHYKNQKEYIVIDTCYIQINNIWKEAVIYMQIENNKKFVRSKKEFLEKFS